jgi:hypothetical protein
MSQGFAHLTPLAFDDDWNSFVYRILVGLSLR